MASELEQPTSGTGHKGRELSVSLVPDRFGLYRYTIFRRLSDSAQNGFKLTIYADTEEDVAGLKLVDAAYCDLDYNNGGIAWVRIHNYMLKRICFWQSGLLRMVWHGKHDVHVYWGEAHRISTWLSAGLSRLLGKRVVFWTHGVYGNEGFLRGVIRRSFYRLANAVLLYGNHARGLMIQSGFDERRLYVIRNSLDVSTQNKVYAQSKQRAQELRDEFLPDGGRMLVFIGRISTVKRLDLLLKVLKELQTKKPETPYRLLFVGDGSERQALTDYARELGIEKDVIFYGACYDEATLAPLIMMADVCVSPGNVGLTAMHSLIFGTPVVTHDNFAEQMPEFEAIEEGRSGAFYRYGDPDDLCVKIEHVLQLIDAGTITSESCRENILKYYNTEYQYSVFSRMLNDLPT